MTVTRYCVPATIEACEKLMSPPAVDVCPVSKATSAPVLMLLMMTVIPVSLTRRFPVVRSRKSVIVIVPDEVSPVNDPDTEGSGNVVENENDAKPALADPENTGRPAVTAKLVTGETLADPENDGSAVVTEVSKDAPDDPTSPNALLAPSDEYRSSSSASVSALLNQAAQTISADTEP